MVKKHRNTYNSSVLVSCLQQQELDPIALHNKSKFASSQLNNTNVVIRVSKSKKTLLSSLPIERASSTNYSHCMNVHVITKRDKHLVAHPKVKRKHLLATRPRSQKYLDSGVFQLENVLPRKCLIPK